jgi:hypothetical protein
MKVRLIYLSVFTFAAMLSFASSGRAAEMAKCSCQSVTPASYTWNFSAEANRIFTAIQPEAEQALTDADYLDADAHDYELDWQIQAPRLNALRDEINDLSPELCRLETIRRVVKPWQQNEIDRLKAALLLMVNNTTNAIGSMNAHQSALWLPRYEQSASNLYDDAHDLVTSVDTAVSQARRLSKGHETATSSRTGD